MDFVIREYREGDRTHALECIRSLQRFIHDVDPLKIVRHLDHFQEETYLENLQKDISKQDGGIFLAFDGDEIAGCVIGDIPPQSEHSQVDHYPIRSGVIRELIVLDSFRSKGIGAMLMERMELYFKEKECEVIRVAVMSANQNAHRFYQKMGYDDRTIDMIKKL